MDLITTCVTDRFDQPGYKIYQNLETLLLNVVNSKDYKGQLDAIVSFYGSDFNAQLLETQLKIVSITFPKEPSWSNK